MSTGDELLALVAALIDVTHAPDAEHALNAVASALEERGIPVLRGLPLATYGEPDAMIDLSSTPGWPWCWTRVRRRTWTAYSAAQGLQRLRGSRCSPPAPEQAHFPPDIPSRC